MIVAHQARVGVFEGLQAFQAAGKQAVRLPINVQSSQGRSQSVMSAVLDEIDCWCYSIAAALKRYSWMQYSKLMTMISALHAHLQELQ